MPNIICLRVLGFQEMNFFRRWITLKIHARFDRSLYNTNRDRGQLADLVHEMSSWTKRLEDEDYGSILELCGKLRALTEGKDVHAHISFNKLERDRYLGTKLTEMYGKCGKPEEARSCFSRIVRKDIVAWTTVIAACARNGEYKSARDHFLKMKLQPVQPDEAAYVAVLGACVGSEVLAEGKTIHASITRSGMESQVEVGKALINMYGKCGSLEDALKVFKKIKAKYDVGAWIIMIALYAEYGQSKEAAGLFHWMLLEGVLLVTKQHLLELLESFGSPGELERGRLVHTCVTMAGLDQDEHVRIAVLGMYGRCGSLDDARNVFDEVEEKQQDVNLFRALMEAFVEQMAFKEAMQTFREMERKNVVPDRCIFLALLKSCGNFDDCKLAHLAMKKHKVKMDEIYKNQLIRNYRRCPEVPDAEKMFEQLEGVSEPDPKQKMKVTDERLWLKTHTGVYGKIYDRKLR